ncbi:hypothetical protein OV760_26845, partial [Salmonella enterica subsp. enterica serovar 1,4,[5],12:i:-]|nr:hypothetical protein [Salmonella enterica subsp. enterica serovar 1,4,[5],12:i:-]
ARSSVVLLAVLALAALAQAKPKPAEAAMPDFSQMLKEMQTSFESSVKEAKKNLNLPENPDGAAIVKAIREQSNKAEKAFTEMKAKLEESVKKNPELSGAIENLKGKIEEAREKLKKENPEAAANVQKVADVIKSGYEGIGKELEKIQQEATKKGGLREDLESLFKNIIDRGVAAGKDFQSKIDAAVKEMTAQKKA